MSILERFRRGERIPPRQEARGRVPRPEPVYTEAEEILYEQLKPEVDRIRNRPDFLSLVTVDSLARAIGIDLDQAARLRERLERDGYIPRASLPLPHGPGSRGHQARVSSARNRVMSGYPPEPNADHDDEPDRLDDDHDLANHEEDPEIAELQEELEDLVEEIKELRKANKLIELERDSQHGFRATIKSGLGLKYKIPLEWNEGKIVELSKKKIRVENELKRKGVGGHGHGAGHNSEMEEEPSREEKIERELRKTRMKLRKVKWSSPLGLVKKLTGQEGRLRDRIEDLERGELPEDDFEDDEDERNN